VCPSLSISLFFSLARFLSLSLPLSLSVCLSLTLTLTHPLSRMLANWSGHSNGHCPIYYVCTNNTHAYIQINMNICIHIQLYTSAYVLTVKTATLQHTATRCNTPQHTAKHCNTLMDDADHADGDTTQHTATVAQFGCRAKWARLDARPRWRKRVTSHDASPSQTVKALKACIMRQLEDDSMAMRHGRTRYDRPYNTYASGQHLWARMCVAA